MLYIFLSFPTVLAFDCDPDLCDLSLIGDGNCDPNCMIDACIYDAWESKYSSNLEMMKSSDCLYQCISRNNCTLEMLKNDQCDDECNFQECGYDLGKCGYCAKDCLKSMVSNGICDTACNNSACKFDLNDCGICAPDCKSEWVNNGVCELECFNDKCDYDGTDCGCAPGCLTTDYGNCKPECMVPDCNYDSVIESLSCPDNYLRTFNKYYQLWNYDFEEAWDISYMNCQLSVLQDGVNGICSSDCQDYDSLYQMGGCSVPNTCQEGCLVCAGEYDCLKCDYSNGYINYFTTCVTSCPQWYYQHPLIPSICYRKEDYSIFSNPSKIYVDYNTTDATKDGSKNHPYKTLAEALDSACDRYIEILLKPGIHEVEESYWYWNSDIQVLTIRTDCDSCSKYAIIDIKNSEFLLEIYDIHWVYFENIVFDRQSIAQPYAIESLDVSNTIVVCPQNNFESLIYIEYGTWLYAVNTTFQNMEYNLQSIIFSQGGLVELYNTNFINIKTYSCSDLHGAIILQCDYSCYENALIYKNGNVELNNGFFSTIMDFASGFLVANYTGEIMISNVNFSNSLALCGRSAVPSLYCGLLIAVINCQSQFIIENCEFDTIYSREALIFYGNDLNIDYKKTFKSGEYIIFPRIKITNNRFNFIGASYLVWILLYTGIPEIFISDLYIENSVFTDTALNIMSFVYGSEYVSIVDVENIIFTKSWSGFIFTASPGLYLNVTLKGFYPSYMISNLTLDNMIFPYFNFDGLSVYDEGYIPLYFLILVYMPHHCSISDIIINNTLFNKDPAPSYQFSAITVAYAYYKTAVSNIFIDSLVMRSLYPPISMLNGNYFMLENITITNTVNLLYNGAIEVKDASYALLSKIYLNNIYGSLEGGIFSLNCDYFIVINSYFSKVVSEMEGVIGIRNCSTFTYVFNSTFMENEGIAILITEQATKDTIVYIENSKFILNHNVGSGSAISFFSYEVPEYLNNTIITKGCIFLSNTQYPIMIYNNSNYQDYNSSFSYNDCVLIAAGFSYQNFMFYGTLFYQNYVHDGMIWIKNGTLGCLNCHFINNTQLLIYVFDDSYFLLENSEFVNNTSSTSSLIVAHNTININYIYNSTFINNHAVYNPIIQISGSKLIAEKLLIKDNSSLNPNEPVIYIQNASSVLIEDSLFGAEEINAAEIVSINSVLSIENCEFDFINASSSGLIFISDGQLYIHNSKMRFMPSFIFSAIASSFISTVNANYIELKDSVFSNSFAQGILLKETATILIENCTFNDGTNYNFVQIVNYGFLGISNTLFLNNTSTLSGGALCISNYDSTSVTLIENSLFANNSASNKGGALVLDCCNARILNSKFINNTASEGGAGYVKCNIGAATNYFLKDSFTQNIALIGASLCIEGNYPNISSSEYFENYAEYGNETALWPIGLARYENSTFIGLEGYTISYYDGVCKLDSTFNFSFGLYDANSELVTGGFDGYTASLKPISTDSSINGVAAVHPNKGIIEFINLSFLCTPGSEINMVLTYSGSIDYWSASLNRSINLNLNVSLITRDCINGEYRAENQCIYCKEGQYSLSPDENCDKCPLNAYCYGGNLLVPMPGYWRGNTNYTKIYGCLYFYACEGGLTTDTDSLSLTGRCREGYRGNLCQACDYGFSSSSGNRCEKCPSKQENIIRLIGLGISIILVLIAIVYLTFVTAYEPISISSIFFKILLNYFQVISIIIKLKLPWPWYTESWLTYQSYPGDTPTHLFSIDCLLIDENDPDSYKSIYFDKLIIFVCVPAALGQIVVIFWWLFALFKNIRFSSVKNELIATLWILHFLLLPTITNYMFSIFSCIDIYEDLYLTSNLDIKCWDETHSMHAFSIALPGIIIWTIAIPLGIFLYLQKIKKRLYRLETMLRFGFIYNGYRESKFYWEFVILLRKLLMIWITIFFENDNEESQAIVCFTVLLIFFYLQYSCYPFEYVELNRVELISIFTELTTIYCGLYYMTNELSSGVEIFFFVLLLLSNAYFICEWLINILKKYIIFIIKRVNFLNKLIKVENMEDYKNCEDKKKIRADLCEKNLEIKDNADLSLWIMRKIAADEIKENKNLQESAAEGSYYESQSSAVFSNID